MKRPFRTMMAAAVVVLMSAMSALAGDGAAPARNGVDDSTIESLVFSGDGEGGTELVDPLEGYIGLSIEDEDVALGSAHGKLQRGDGERGLDATGLFSGK